jgi:hypothetical protein
LETGPKKPPRRFERSPDVPNADFSIVLVYDVSRWGRFQDADESAYYEYRCRRAQIAVHYCAEPFQNDGSLTTVLMKPNHCSDKDLEAGHGC